MDLVQIENEVFNDFLSLLDNCVEHRIIPFEWFASIGQTCEQSVAVIIRRQS